MNQHSNFNHAHAEPIKVVVSESDEPAYFLDRNMLEAFSFEMGGQGGGHVHAIVTNLPFKIASQIMYSRYGEAMMRSREENDDTLYAVIADGVRPADALYLQSIAYAEHNEALLSALTQWTEQRFTMLPNQQIRETILEVLDIPQMQSQEEPYFLSFDFPMHDEREARIIVSNLPLSICAQIMQYLHPGEDLSEWAVNRFYGIVCPETPNYQVATIFSIAILNDETECAEAIDEWADDMRIANGDSRRYIVNALPHR